MYFTAVAVACVWVLPSLSWAQALEIDPTIGNTQQAQPVEGQQTAQPVDKRQPIKLSVTESFVLPPDMYGQWSVVATLVKTNLPGQQKRRVYDIWQLSEAGNQVSLSNPNTGAFATITVDDVEGNTASFHHRVVMKPGRQFLVERPTVTVVGDRMRGTTTHTYVHTSRNGQVERVYHALFKIEAARLAQNRVEFANPNPALDLQIEDIQPGVEPSSPATIDSSLFH